MEMSTYSVSFANQVQFRAFSFTKIWLFYYRWIPLIKLAFFFKWMDLIDFIHYYYYHILTT